MKRPAIRHITNIMTIGLMFFVFAPANAQNQDDVKAVEAAANNYLLGFYEGKPELLEKVLSPELKKLGWWRPNKDEDYQGPFYISKEESLEFAPRYAAGQNLPSTAYRKITVFEVLDKTAVVKAEAVWGVDYLHLAKIDDQWLIYNAIWQSWPDGNERK